MRNHVVPTGFGFDHFWPLLAPWSKSVVWVMFWNRTCTGTKLCSTDFLTCQLRRFDKKYFRNFFLAIFFIFLLEWYHTKISFYHYFLLDQYYTIRENVRGRGLMIGRLRTGRGRRRPRMAFLYIFRTSEYQERYEDVRGRQGSKITRVQDKDVRGRRRPRLGLGLGRGRRYPRILDESGLFRNFVVV